MFVVFILTLTIPLLAFASGRQRAAGNGPYHHHSWTYRGVQGWVACPTTRQRRKVRSFYIYDLDKPVNTAEIGWRWKTWSKPKAFWVIVIDSNYFDGNIADLDPGSTHLYTTRYMFGVGPGTYRWNFYLDGQLKAELDLHMDEGWAIAGCERGYDGDKSWPDANSAFFYNMEVWSYYPQRFWTWRSWVMPNDWPQFANDPDYKFYPHVTYPTDKVECR